MTGREHEGAVETRSGFIPQYIGVIANEFGTKQR